MKIQPMMILVRWLDLIKGNVFRAYSGYNIVDIQKKLVVITSLIKKIEKGKGASETCRILGSHSGGYEQFYLLGYNLM
jgi:hypothetical protein